MNELDRKINEHFEGKVVRKDLPKTVKGNAVVPTYVLEYLLGQYCATRDEASVESGIDRVREILRVHYVHRNEAGLVKSKIKEQGRHKVIDKVSVALNDKAGVYEAAFANLGIRKVLVDAETVKQNPRLLVSGVWSIAGLSYEFNDEPNRVPWVLESLKPIQLARFDFEEYKQMRRRFTEEEWTDLLLQSMGFNPEFFGRRSKLFQLVRLIPYCERNYNLIELGPKGTGKSHIYSEFSPHGILISGGEVTVPKLFVNNSTGKVGLVGYWDTVAFDEFAGSGKRTEKALVDILKNYMANKSFSRGIETIGAEASMVFVGNTQHNVPYLLKYADLFDALPPLYHDSAFLDRLHFYLPGWEVDIIRGEMFSSGYGFVVDYLAEAMRAMRQWSYADLYREHAELFSDISTRDREGFQKTFSGMMKILYPHREATHEQIVEMLEFCMEGRKRVKDQLLRIDSTYAPVDFGYRDLRKGGEQRVTTLEEEQYPQYYGKLPRSEEEQPEETTPEQPVGEAAPTGAGDEPPRQFVHSVYQENQTGVTYDRLFADYLRGAGTITLTDPYIRAFYQIRNLMEFLETVIRSKEESDEVHVHLHTCHDKYEPDDQEKHFAEIRENVATAGVHFTWDYDESGLLHARSVVTDRGWKISLERGLDIFQKYDMGNHFSLANRGQAYRPCKSFEITYLPEGVGE